MGKWPHNYIFKNTYNIKINIYIYIYTHRQRKDEPLKSIMTTSFFLNFPYLYVACCPCCLHILVFSHGKGLCPMQVFTRQSRIWTRVQEWTRVRNLTCLVKTFTGHNPHPSHTILNYPIVPILYCFLGNLIKDM